MYIVDKGLSGDIWVYIYGEIVISAKDMATNAIVCDLDGCKYGQSGDAIYSNDHIIDVHSENGILFAMFSWTKNKNEKVDDLSADSLVVTKHIGISFIDESHAKENLAEAYD